MRVLFVADASSIHTRRWLEYFRNRGFDVHVASFSSFEIPGVTFHRIRTFGLGKLGYFYALFALPRIFASVKPNLVHAHYLTSYGFLAALSGIKPLIVTAWGSDALIAPRKSIISKFFASYAVRHSTTVTSLAVHMNESVAALGVPLSKITATPFGVDTNLFKPVDIRLTNSNLPTIICTRNFSNVYDVKTLIYALHMVFTGGNLLRVHLVGDGPLRSELIKLTERLGLDQYIQFHGHVDHSILVPLLAESDIFVTPAISDGNNVSLNEAMACGCFPIATDIPANSQWITHNWNGFLYPPGDVELLAKAIEAALNNSKIKDFARLQNRQIVETMADWRICTSRMEEIYRKVVNEGGFE